MICVEVLKEQEKKYDVENLLPVESEAFKIGHWIQKAIYELVRTGKELEQILNDLTFTKDSETTFFQSRKDINKNLNDML